MIDLALAIASVAILVVLLYIYVSNFRALRAPLSLGLIVFAGLFLVENLAAIYFYVTMSEGGLGASVAMPMLDSYQVVLTEPTPGCVTFDPTLENA